MEKAVLELNNAYAEELSYLDYGQLRWLVEHAFHARRVGDLDGFLLAFDESAEYRSPNYLWFRQRYPRFVYVDRVVITPGARRRGLARSLYMDLFCKARRAGREIVGCEVNVAPPNPTSDAFHVSLGFSERGRAVANQKLVRYLVRPLDARVAKKDEREESG
ncbi:GNAT family N-acetyltransferase [uncultured Bradyrhizobium sp.]|uniref:GNAT family N-acetyltransferase n=1 Tax=uncultured Bradyrhizobium sp. TaxID=199684 RepID=UPI0035CAE770